MAAAAAICCLLLTTIIHDVVAAAANNNHRTSDRLGSSSASHVVRELHQNERRAVMLSNDMASPIIFDDDDDDEVPPSPPPTGPPTIKKTPPPTTSKPSTASPNSPSITTSSSPTSKLSSSSMPTTQRPTGSIIMPTTFMPMTVSPVNVAPTSPPTVVVTQLTSAAPTTVLAAPTAATTVSPSTTTTTTTSTTGTILIDPKPLPMSPTGTPSMGSSAEPSVHSSSEGPSIGSSEMPSVQSLEMPFISSSAWPSMQSSEMPSVSSSAEPSVQSSEVPSTTKTEVPSESESQPTSHPRTTLPTEVATNATAVSTSPPTAVVTSQPTTSSPTVVATSQSPTTLNGKGITCPEGTCPNPNNGMCQSKVECLVGPCEVNSCTSGVCEVNYCGGCHAICVVEDDDVASVETTSTSQPFGSSTSALPSVDDEIAPAEQSFPTAAPSAAFPIVQIPKMTFTLIETDGILSTQALEDVTSSIEAFLTAQLDEYYNNNAQAYFSGIHLNVVDDHVVARAAPRPDEDGGGRRELQEGVVIGTEIIINGVADFVDEAPSPAEIVSEISYIGKRYNEYLISNITSSGSSSELEGVYLVEVGYYSRGKGESIVEKTLPAQDDEVSGSNSKNIITGTMKNNEVEPEDKSSRFYVIATVAGVATLMMLIMFVFTSRERSRSSRSRSRRDLVTVPISVVASGSRSSGSKGEEDDEVGSDPYIKCHKKGDSHISDLTTLASQPFARIVRTQSELDKDLEQESVIHYPIVRTQSELQREYESKIMGDEEDNFFTNRVNSCYTQDYSSYYNSSRSRSQEETPSNPEMMDGSYIPSGWHASRGEGGFRNSLTDYHRRIRSESESSIEGAASVSAAGSIKRSGSQLSRGSIKLKRVKRSSSQLSHASSGSQLSRASKGLGSRFSHAKTPTASNMSTAQFFHQECNNEISFVDQPHCPQSLNLNNSEVSEHTSDTSASPRNDALPEEWLSAMHTDSASVIYSHPAISHQSLEQNSAEVSEHSSLSARNDSLPEEWLTEMHGDRVSVASSLDVNSSHGEKPSFNEKSGAFLSSLDYGLEEEDSEPSVYLQRKRSRTMNEDAFSATSSEEEEQFPVKKERVVNVRDSADLLSLVDSIVGSSMGGPSLADLVWLEKKISEKDAASAIAMNRKD